MQRTEKPNYRIFAPASGKVLVVSGTADVADVLTIAAALSRTEHTDQEVWHSRPSLTTYGQMAA